MQLSPGSLSAGTVGLAEPGLRHGGIAQTWEPACTCACGAAVSEFPHGSPRETSGAGVTD